MRSFAVFVSLLVVSVLAKEQTIRVKGTTICNKKRLANVEVFLYEKDSINFDDKLNTTKTSKDGDFDVFGKDNEILSIEPYMIFKHDCNAEKNGKKCTRETTFPIPKDKINGVYDMTYVALDIIQHQDKFKC